MARDTRDRMLLSAVTLLRERGAGAFSVDAVLAHSGAPRGSVYHHFPGGRNELLLSAVRLAGDYIDATIVRAADSPVALLDGLVTFWSRALSGSDHRAGCPVLALAIDQGAEVPGAADLVREIFTSWQDRLAALLTASGTPPDEAYGSAVLVIAAIEGAVALCRVHRSARPLEAVADRLRPILAP